MASINWVAERAIPLLKMNPTLGASEMQKQLRFKYNIEIPYQFRNAKLGLANFSVPSKLV